MKMRLTAILLLLSAVVAAVTGAACSSASAPAPPSGIVLGTPVPDPTATPQAVVTSFEGRVMEFEVNLAANGSPQQGTAVFTRQGAATGIEVRLQPGVRAQLVTLRRGRCPFPEGFVQTLDVVIGGVMRQTLRNRGFDDLLAGDLTLAISKDDDTFQSIAACGDLPEVE